MRLQTCRRHPNTGPFMRACPGCTQDLHDTEARNRAHAAARAALAAHGMTDAEILSVHATPTTLIVATHQPHSLAYEYAVDAFRLPTAAESDPEAADWYRLPHGEWHLDWQAGEHTRDRVPQMAADARAHLITTGRITPSTPTVTAPAPTAPAATLPVVRLHHLPGSPALPDTQGDAGRAEHAATSAFWDHAEHCPACLNARDTTTATGEHCQAGATLTQLAEAAATVARDFLYLDDWYRRGGRERHNASDYIAS